MILRLQSVAAAVVLPAVVTGLLATAAVAAAHAFAMPRCLARGAGLPPTAAGTAAWTERELAARVLACREAERAHRERARWEAEHQVAGERARTLEVGARFRAERARAGLEVPAPAPVPPARASLPPCPRPDAAGECAATAEQILYQIEKSRAGGGAERPVAP